MNINKNFAFTLAETLITLVIIGVVAALTVPTMIANYINTQTSTKIKKSYSEVLNAIHFSQSDNGVMNTWDWTNVGSNQIQNSAFIDKYLAKYIRTTKCDQTTNTDCKYGGISKSVDVRYILDNGTMLVFRPYNTKKILLMIVSGKLGQEKLDAGITMGRDKFYFQIENDKVLPFGYMQGITREDLLNGCVDIGGNSCISCKKNGNNGDETSNPYYRYGCTYLLYLDNWEFKNDYPWK